VPVPEAKINASQGAVLVAVQEHPAPAVTPTDCTPPTEVIETGDGLAEKLQPALSVVKVEIAEPVVPTLFLATTCQ
jgi:hypothetical protein